MKAQASTHVFVYILAAVVAGIILYVGAKSIITIINTMNQVNIDDFKSGFENAVTTISRQYGSVKKYQLDLHESFEEICFVDSRNENGVFSDSVKNNIELSKYTFIKDSVDTDAKDNVFLLKKKIIEQRFEVKDLDVEQDFLCLDNEGLLIVWLRGTGKNALLYTQ